LWAEVTGLLAGRKEDLHRAIASYPTPIAGCDEQFDYLLEQQARIADELAGACNAMAQPAAAGESLRAFCDFVRWSRCLDEDSKQRLFRRLESVVRDRRSQ
jgi:hypothetical protein